MADGADCPDCGTQVASRLLACPSCGWLVHGRNLERLAKGAREAEAADRLRQALTAWRDALDLLPPSSRQAQVIGQRIEGLGRRVDAGEGVDDGPAPAADDGADRPRWLQGGGVLVAAVLVLWKLKWLVGFLLTKGKLLLLGLTKSTTFFSMVLAAGVYWRIWGWEFAIGLVLSIYVHEMGHVAALRHYGIRATAPMFLPGFGAFVRLRQYPASPREDARVGLAGPLWGLGAVVAAWLAYLATGRASLAAIAHFSAWINLFNLLPIWQLDGGRGFRALSRLQRWQVVAALGAGWFYTQDGLFALLVLVAAGRSLLEDGAADGDVTSFVQFLLLIAGFSASIGLDVPNQALWTGSGQ